MSAKLKPGNITPTSGQYELVGPRGGRTGREVTSTQGHPLPPTQSAGQAYILADSTKRKK